MVNINNITIIRQNIEFFIFLSYYSDMFANELYSESPSQKDLLTVLVDSFGENGNITLNPNSMGGGCILF